MALSLNNSRLTLNSGKTHGTLVEEIDGLIRVYRDGHVERPTIIPNVPCNVPSELKVISRDITIDRFTNLWARLYVPQHVSKKLPLVVYFHGGGFCVGSASWSCYHDFLANLASKAGCLIMSVNYRLAPETRLPGAYEDGFNTIIWLKQVVENRSNEHLWWLSCWDVKSGFFLGGDSAGANIAYNVSTRIGIEPSFSKILCHKGNILIQPFFGGEVRTKSEKGYQNPGSALTLSASDKYWRLSLPIGANRDHPWCNPLSKGGGGKLGSISIPGTLLCVSEMDILMDRNIEMYTAMVNAGKVVKMAVYKGVGHAFQILHNSPLSNSRTQEMISHLKSFINT